MKAVAYSIRSFEREFLAKANQKKHDITLITNSLSPETATYAEGKKAVIVFSNDKVTANLIEQLAGFGIKYLLTRSTGTEHIDKVAAEKHHIKIAKLEHGLFFKPNQAYLTKEALQEIADQTIKNLDEIGLGL
jgi:D-lactate dehydrogenase